MNRIPYIPADQREALGYNAPTIDVHAGTAAPAEAAAKPNPAKKPAAKPAPKKPAKKPAKKK